MEYRFLLSTGIILVLVNIFEASNGLEDSTLVEKSSEVVPVQLANCSSTSEAIYQCIQIEDCKAKQRPGSRRFCKWDGGPTHVCCPQNSDEHPEKSSHTREKRYDPDAIYFEDELRRSSKYESYYDNWSDEDESWERPDRNSPNHLHHRFGHDHDYKDDVESFDDEDWGNSFEDDEPECGVLEEEERGKILSYAVGGSPVRTAASSPWMVAIGRSEPDKEPKWFCGGALISRNIVITAAHCITKSEANLVRVGELDLISTTEPAEPQDSAIESSVIHEGYKQPRHYHDIAIIRLKTPVKYSKYVRPICLPPNDGNLYENATVTLTGWGSGEYGGRRSSILQEVQISVSSNSQCNAKYSNLSTIRNNAEILPDGIIKAQLCAGDKIGGRDACQGDSGGPIVLKKGRKRLVIGLVSSGLGCGSKIYPGIYTRVSYYSDWIRSFL